MAGESNTVEIVVKVTDLASSQILELEKQIKHALGRVASPTSGTVYYAKQKEDIDALSTALKGLSRTYASLAPRLDAVKASLAALSPQHVRAAVGLERIAQAAIRTKITQEQLAQAQLRTQIAAQRLALTTQQLANAQQRSALSADAAKRSEERHARAMSGVTKTAATAGFSFGRTMTSLGAALSSTGGISGRFFKTLAAGFTSMPAQVAYGLVAFFSLRKAIEKAYEAIKFGLIKVIDDLRMKSLAIAGALKISVPEMPITQAVANADALIEKSFALSRQFIGSAREMQVLIQSLATFGVKVDMVTEKGAKQFITFGNILKLLTVGQNFEIQAMQEIRAIMQGQNFQGAMLARTLQAQGVNVAKMGPLWIRQGRFIDEVVNRLGGYKEIIGLIEHTLSSQLKLTGSIVALILKGGLKKAYSDVLWFVERINWYLMGWDGLTEQGQMWVKRIEDAWKGVLWFVMRTIKAMLWYYAILQRTLELVAGYNRKIWKGPTLQQNVENIFTGVADWFGKKADAQKVVKDMKSNWDAISSAVMGQLEAQVKEMDEEWTPKWFKDLEEDLRFKEAVESYKGFIPIERGIPEMSERNWALENAMREAEQFKERVLSFIDEQRREIREKNLNWDYSWVTPYKGFIEGVPKWTADVESVVRNEQDKVIKMFDKFFRDEKFKELVKKDPIILKKMRELFNELMRLAEDKAVEDAYEKIGKKFEKMTDSYEKAMADADELFRSKMDKYAPEEGEEGPLGRWLQREYASIDKSIQKLRRKMMEGLEDIADPEYAQGVGLAVMELENLRNTLREAAEGKFFDDTARGMESFREETAALRRELNTPLAMPWNEDQIRIAEATTKAMEEYRKGMDKVAEDRKKFGTEGNLEAFRERESVLWEKMLSDVQKAKDQQDVVLNAVKDAWTETFSGINNLLGELFFDAMKAEFKSLEDYIIAFTDIVRRAFANMVADIITRIIQQQFGNALADNLMDWGKAIYAGLGGLSGGGLDPDAAFMSAMPAGAWGAKEGAIFPGRFIPIRAFAGGGIANRPTLGLIAEAGGEEAVIPLKGGKVPVDLQGGGGQGIVFNIYTRDADDFDSLLMKRRGLITGMLRHELANSGASRAAIKRWGR